MGFPDIHSFPESPPGPYERQMGESIVRLLKVFQGRVPDPESHSRVQELACTPDRWSAGHKAFDEVRDRLLCANDGDRGAQYAFEESCSQAMYNAVGPPDPFDPGSPFFIAGQAITLAKRVGIQMDAILDALAQ